LEEKSSRRRHENREEDRIGKKKERFPLLEQNSKEKLMQKQTEEGFPE
jgi:hypothetical protein